MSRKTYQNVELDELHFFGIKQAPHFGNIGSRSIVGWGLKAHVIIQMGIATKNPLL